MHDPHPLQPKHLIVVSVAHASDLSVQSLLQNDPENAFGSWFARGDTGAGPDVVKVHPLTDLFQELTTHRKIQCNNIFLFVRIFWMGDAIIQTANVRQQDQAFGILIEPADGVDLLGMGHRVDDIALNFFGSTNDSLRFVVNNIYRFEIRGPDDLTIHPNVIAFVHFGTEGRDPAIDRHLFVFDQVEGFAP